ncbi:MAG: peptide-methionine (R)-S-oxide reductase MsrB [Patescibacteria group bacterium]|nr:peptide-methionine (R)-S-oxide reductase MsrB [Patescibacteria group bacterium]
MNEEDIKKKLTPEEYEVLRRKGTEAPFSGSYLNERRPGTYLCKACGSPLFPSTAKLDSSAGPAGLAGWPSFDQALPGAVRLQPDDSHGMRRTEVVCARCGSHLGHLFDDEHASTGKHFCLNSVCLDLAPEGRPEGPEGAGAAEATD